MADIRFDCGYHPSADPLSADEIEDMIGTNNKDEKVTELLEKILAQLELINKDAKCTKK